MLRPDDREIGPHELLGDDGDVLARLDIADRQDWLQADVAWLDPAVEPDVVARRLGALLGGLRVATTDDALADGLVRAGGTVARKGTQMEYDAVASLPPGEWLDRSAIDGVELVDYRPVDLEIAAGWLAAYGPEHPDHDPTRLSPEAAREDLRQTQEGTEVLFEPSASALAVEARSGAVLGGIMITTMRPNPLWTGPWVPDVFVTPAAQRRGIGERLVRYAVAAVAQAGHHGLALSVTDGNPARRVYERVGFRPTWTFTSVAMPAT